MSVAAAGAKRLGRAALRVRGAGALARRIAALRGRALVLLYHRVTAEERPASVVVPSVPAGLFRRHIEALADVGRIVPLAELLEEGRRGVPRFAVTLDDDYHSHVEAALPILREAGVPATFFLSGRALHGAGPYWFESLERWIEDRGLPEVAARLGMPGADPEVLARAVEEDGSLRSIVEQEDTGGTPPLDEDGIRALAEAGMAVGFHTVHHPVLTSLPDTDVEAAVRVGRKELTALVDGPLTLFAYPHGRADARVARMVREAGYAAAWTGRPRPMHRGEDRHLLGRWEPGPLSPEELLARVSIRLSRPAPVR